MSVFADMSRFTPHGFCLAWQPGLVWTLALSDMIVAAAYFSIPAALVVFARRRSDLAFRPVFVLFAAFILACGATHVMGALTLWVPAYRLEAWINVVTAALSLLTASMLWPLLPKALALPSPARLREANQALAREIDERNAVAQALRVSEERLKSIYERSPAALHATDACGVLIGVSDRWLELTGYRRDEVIGHPVASFYEPDSAAVSAAQLGALQRGEMVEAGHRRIRRRDGSIRQAEVMFQPEYSDDGKLVGVLAALVDVTARLEAEDALGAAEERLRQSQKMEAVGQLTGGIAHDFNNLLTTIMGSLELLGQRAQLDERCQRLVGNALEGSHRAARLTSQLLSFSRRQRLAPESLSPGDVVAGIGDLLARSLGDGVTLTIDVPASCWLLTADRNQLESALLNLVLNARDALGGHGTVQITVANDTVGGSEAEADGLAPGDYVSLAVRDNGAGMTEEVRQRAFEPFFTTKPAGTGTGLGLSQIYGFVTQSGGTVRLETAPGQGTRIALLLPRSLGQVQPARVNPAPVSGARAPDAGQHDMGQPGGGAHILLVEDDKLLRQTITEALTDRGYRITTAADGVEAVAMIESGAAPDIALLFTDIVMPAGVSGVDLALRARAQFPELPVLFASGYSPAAQLAAWPEPADLLLKPYTSAEAAARVAARLRRKASKVTP